MEMMHNELHNLYSSPNTIRMNILRRMRWVGHVESMGAKRNAYTVLIRNTEWQRTLERPRHRLAVMLRFSYLEETGQVGVDGINLAQKRV
jgi:hypothetical protein